MSETKRNNNLTEKQLRGIYLVVKSASKKFPFIKGWKFSPDWEKYDAHLYIDVYVNWEEVLKFYNETLKPHYEIIYKERPLDKTSSLLSYFGIYEWGSPEQESHFEKSYNEGLKIRDLFKGLYEALPEDFQIYYELDSIIDKNMKVLTRLSVNDYLDYRTME